MNHKIVSSFIPLKIDIVNTPFLKNFLSKFCTKLCFSVLTTPIYDIFINVLQQEVFKCCYLKDCAISVTAKTKA